MSTLVFVHQGWRFHCSDPGHLLHGPEFQFSISIQFQISKYLSIKVGGFIALILGISFMDLMRVAELLKDKMMNKWAEQK